MLVDTTASLPISVLPFQKKTKEEEGRGGGARGNLREESLKKYSDVHTHTHTHEKCKAIQNGV